MDNINKEMEIMEMEHNIRITREDLPGDPLVSAKLVQAASDQDWQQVQELLSDGADPRICRWGTVNGVESALYYALLDRQFEIAGKLYDAGDRLDDLITESEIDLPWQVLDFLSREMHCGRNYFLDESKTLSECCRCAAFEQIKKLMPTASQEELDKSILLIVNAWRHGFLGDNRYVDILKGLKHYGAKLPEKNRATVLSFFERIRNIPAALRPEKIDMEAISDFIDNW